MARLGTLGARLHRGEASYDFIGRRRVWYAFSALLMAVSIAALLLRGLALGIEFRGGSEFTVSGGSCAQAQVADAVRGSGLGGEVTVQTVGGGIRAQTGELNATQSRAVGEAIARTCGVAPGAVSSSFVGPSWGADVSTKALQALAVFLALVAVFLAVYFELKMAIAALIALVHDLLITVGLYALIGFEVTPATVIGMLTILGYSLYDTVVVYDKVKENTHGVAAGTRRTYGEAANLAVNQTLVRSVNTTVIALLPVAAILFVGAGLLGAGTLKDLSLALFIGLATGAYSSIFIATPLLADLKEREPAMKALARRVEARRATQADDDAAGGPAAPDGTGLLPTQAGAHALGPEVGLPLGPGGRPVRPHRLKRADIDRPWELAEDEAPEPAGRAAPGPGAKPARPLPNRKPGNQGPTGPSRRGRRR